MKAQAKNITALPSALLGEERVQALDWEQISQDLDAQGSAVLEHLIQASECQRLSALYPQDELFRSRIVMGDMVLDVASTNTLPIHCPILLQACGQPSTHVLRRSPIAGTHRWA